MGTTNNRVVRMIRTDNPIRDWDSYCEEQERELAMLPICSQCGEPITDEYCYRINDELICDECMREQFMVETPVEEE